MYRSSKEGKLTMQPGHETRELEPPKMEPVMIPRDERYGEHDSLVRTCKSCESC